jgi:glutaminase
MTAGEWAFKVGMPAKSGVAGGILAVKPGQFGVGVFSPPLDEAGNSFRGTMALTMLSRQYGLHLLAHPHVPPSAVKSITRAPDGTVVAVLQGEIDLIAMEGMVARIKDAPGLPGPRAEADAALVLDLADVSRIGAGAARVLAAAERGATMWGHVEVVDPAGVIPRTLAQSDESTD